MNRSLCIGISVILLIFAFGCKNNEETNSEESKDLKSADDSIPRESEAYIAHEKPSDFLPDGYTLFEEIPSGDLNKDGIKDLILIIKATRKDAFFDHEYQGRLDRNRRGIIVLFKVDGGYTSASENYTCFSSEHEDGGVYVPPDLSVKGEKGNLYVHYGHGRYGYWTYTFRFKNGDFELIGYDSSNNMGPVTMSQTSINFVTKKKKESVNINRDNPDDEELFEDTWTAIKPKKTFRLSQIIDFDELVVDPDEEE